MIRCEATKRGIAAIKMTSTSRTTSSEGRSRSSRLLCRDPAMWAIRTLIRRATPSWWRRHGLPMMNRRSTGAEASCRRSSAEMLLRVLVTVGVQSHATSAYKKKLLHRSLRFSTAKLPPNDVIIVPLPNWRPTASEGRKTPSPPRHVRIAVPTPPNWRKVGVQCTNTALVYFVSGNPSGLGWATWPRRLVPTRCVLIRVLTDIGALKSSVVLPVQLGQQRCPMSQCPSRPLWSLYSRLA